nr:RNA-directed DNA polymerase, eukaryota, reverse transcriptase zinc-binding domain protein [Tanacetum cinerariifolium]
MDDKQSKDPFNIYELLNKKKVNDNKDVQSVDNLKYPIGFTPQDVSEGNLNMQDNSTGEENECNQMCYENEKEEVSKTTLKDNVEESVCSGHFKSVEIPRAGGSILQVMDDLINVGQTMGYKMEGVRVPSFSRMLIISVYAPQEVSEKKMLWNYLNDLVDKWNGEVVIMGDFNEVCTRDERFGLCFHEQGAEAFNLFIALGGLLDVPLGGYRFTWSLSSASKMIDYGPVPFRLYHYWFNLEGFYKMLEDTWNEEIYQGDNDVELVAEQTNIMNSIHDIERLKNTELTQKAKLAIRGILNDGVWIEDPIKVEDAFLNHFAERFSYPCHTRLRLELQFPHRITVEQRLDMERDITYDERYWRFMGSDVVAVVNHFFQYGQFPKGGIGVSSDQVEKAAYQIGCVTFTPPFSYLGVKVGGMMSWNSTWNEVIQRLLDRLSKWKMQKLSIRGRLTLLKSVLGSMHTYHIHLFKTPMKVLNTIESIRSKFFNGMEMTEKKMVWVKWSNVLESKQKGGLGVSRFYALNRALIFKWVPFSKFLVVGASH